MPNLDPELWLGGASTIGMACLLTFVFSFVKDYSDVSGPVVWIVTFVGGGVMLLAAFFFYLVTSKHPKWYGKLGDAACGAWPYLFVGMGVCYVYVCLGTACYHVRHAKIEDQILVYTCVPLYLALWLPMFVFMLYLQATEPEGRKLPKGRLKASVLVLVRSTVAFVASSTICGYYLIPAFIIAWICVGLYMAWEVHIAIPIVILSVLVVTAIVCAVFFPKAVIIPARATVAYYTRPVVGWAPRTGSWFPRFDNSVVAHSHTNGPVSRTKTNVPSKPQHRSAADGGVVVEDV